MTDPQSRLSAHDIAERLAGGHGLLPGGLLLGLDDMTIRVRSNSAELLENLQGYFSHIVIADTDTDTDTFIDLHAFECAAPDLSLDYVDWPREAGKTGRKDAFFDLADGRIVTKVRTGMVFLQSKDHRIAAGPCLENDNQVINFINAQYMNMLQQNGWSICHAAGLVRNGRALGLAGFSGGGKSTLMLHMLGNSDTAFLTNDRLFAKRSAASDDAAKVWAAGIPKLPRINPGTALNNPLLGDIVDAKRRRELASLSKAELWDIEEKYDVDINQVYGTGRINGRAPLCGFVILNWAHDSTAPTKITRVDLAQRRDLLAAVMKSPGPFYQRADGSMYESDAVLAAEPYLATFAGVPVYEVTGQVDFDRIAQQCEALFGDQGGLP